MKERYNRNPPALFAKDGAGGVGWPSVLESCRSGYDNIADIQFEANICS